MWEKGTLMCIVGGYGNWLQPPWKTAWGFLRKLKIQVTYDPEIPLWGIYLKKTKTRTQKDINTPLFTTALFTRAKTWKQLKCSLMDEQINNVVYTHIYT